MTTVAWGPELARASLQRRDEARRAMVRRAGERYFFSPKMAAYADVGRGGAAFNVGLTFKLQ